MLGQIRLQVISLLTEHGEQMIDVHALIGHHIGHRRFGGQ
jgi:hypothetical protein